jgi:hypothetical protein
VQAGWHSPAAGPSEVTVPLFTREIVEVLSVPVRMVQWHASWSLAMTTVWPVMAACSRSLLVMVPQGLEWDTSADFRREWAAPQVRVAPCVAVDAVHTSFGGVGGS